MNNVIRIEDVIRAGREAGHSAAHQAPPDEIRSHVDAELFCQKWREAFVAGMQESWQSYFDEEGWTDMIEAVKRKSEKRQYGI